MLQENIHWRAMVQPMTSACTISAMSDGAQQPEDFRVLPQKGVIVHEEECAIFLARTKIMPRIYRQAIGVSS